MPEPAELARRPAGEAAAQKAPAGATAGNGEIAELLNRRSEAKLADSTELLQRRAATDAADAPATPVRELGPQPIQPPPNRTGLPDKLKAGVEALSGLSMDDVRVHRNSSEPARLGALAYAQGSNIHLAPGQEKHLPHEAWHVVQQKQGRVTASESFKSGVPLNDDRGLEREADVMGQRAASQGVSASIPGPAMRAAAGVVQRRILWDDPVIVKNRNVAVSWKGGGDYAVTPAIINDREIPPTLNRVGLIHPPDFDFKDTPGQDGAPPASEAFYLTVDVPIQTVSYRIECPTEGPTWALGRNVTVGELEAFLSLDGTIRPAAVTDVEEQLAATLIVHEDGPLRAKIIEHEEHHAQEQIDAIDDILRPWDAELERRVPNGQELRGRGPLELLSAFDRRGSGQPLPTAQQVADDLVNRMEQDGLAYHDTDEGKPPEISDYRIDKAQGLWTYHLWLRL